MARIAHPPRNLTPDLTEAILNCAEDAAAGNGPTSPLDWIAARAGVKKLTVRRWMREAVRLRKAEITGPIAGRWIAFADAVDQLVAACANSVCDAIGTVAADVDNKKRLDALLAIQRRIDKHEADLDAVDLDVDGNQSVAHIPQELLDRLSPEQLDQLLRAEEMIAAALKLRDQILDSAQDALISAPESSQ